MKFRPFNQARRFVQTLGIKSQGEWREYCKSGNKPEDIPYSPERVYKDNWIGYADWLGTGRIANQDRKYLPIEEAKKIVHPLGLRNQTEWRKYSYAGKKSQDIPNRPDAVYENWEDWLGPRYRPFDEARCFVRHLGLKSSSEWRKYSKSENKPKDIPANPAEIYKKEWKGMGDWLGTGFVATSERKYLPFEEGRKFVHSFGFKDREEWKQYCKSGKKVG